MTKTETEITSSTLSIRKQSRCALLRTDRLVCEEEEKDDDEEEEEDDDEEEVEDEWDEERV